jgi:hypothetical protein
MSIKERTIPTITVIGFLIYCISKICLKGFNTLSDDMIFATAGALSIFVFPGLVSKTIFRKNYFGIGYILATLIYPIYYLLIYFLGQRYNIDTVNLYQKIAVIHLSVTLLLLLINVYTEKRTNAKEVSKAIIGAGITIGIILLLRYILGLTSSSVLSLDFLQHNTVAIQMGEGRLCLTPNECSSLFKQLGYTTYFHTIQTLLTVGFNLPLGIAETAFELGFTAISVLLIFYLFQQRIKDDEQSFIGALISVFFFELGAYTFSFTIPQTLTFLFFLMVLAEKDLNWKKILVVIPLLTAVHFIFGPLFAVILIIYNSTYKQEISGNKVYKTLTILSIIAIIFSLTANYRGFSVEKVMQLPQIESLGYYTNYYFPDNLMYLAQQYGFFLLLLLIAVIYSLITQKNKKFVYFSIFYIGFCYTCYFLAPTYANKFLIGSTVFGSYLITNMLSSIHFSKLFRFILIWIIFISIIPFYLVNHAKYDEYYTQSEGTISAITRNDKTIISQLEENDYQCQIISDPYTQLIISSTTDYDTSGGQYQDLETRKSLLDFVTNPNNETYENLLVSREIKTMDFCILITGRIISSKEYVNQDKIPWINSLLEYELNNNEKISNNTELIDLLISKGYKVSYNDSHFLLLTQ